MRTPEHKKGTAQLFDNKLIELLSRTTPTLTLMTFLPMIIISLYLTFFEKHLPIVESVLAFIIGIFCWTFLEYIIHRFVFHITGNSERMKRIRYVMHEVHHEYPLDHERLFMPPIPGIIIAIVVFSIFSVLAGKWIWPLFAGIATGYLIYVFTHYAIHKFKPPQRLKFVWKHHSHHHYQDDDRAFGVSNTFWDRLFGTMPKK